MKIKKRDGHLEQLSFDKIIYRLRKLCNDVSLGLLDSIDPDVIAQRVVSSIYDGVTSCELDEEAARIAISMTENPEYQKLASRIIISNAHKSTHECFSEVMERLYNNKDKIGNSTPIIADDVIEIIRKHKNRLNFAIDFKRDYLFDYFGYKTLERSYLQKIMNKETDNMEIVERPQHLYMRVAVGIHKDNIESILKTYELISQHYYTHATPTLFNAGTRLANLSSCFHEDAIVATINRGPVKIKDVEIGDQVITHKGNIKKVVQLHKNLLGNRKLYELSIAKTAPVKVTNNHKLWVIKANKNTTRKYFIENDEEFNGKQISLENNNLCDNQDKQKNSYQKYNLEFVKDYLKTDNCELLSLEYKNIKSKLQFKCCCGQICNKSFESIYYNNVRCNDKKCIYERRKKIKIDYKAEWISVDQLEKGDYIGIPNKLESVKNLDILDISNIKINLQIESQNNLEYQINLENDDYLIMKSKWTQVGKFKQSNRNHNSIKRFWNIDENFAKFIGIFYGDGHIMTSRKRIRGIGITIHNINQKLIDFCKSYGEELFGIQPIIHTMKNQNTVQVLFSSTYIGYVFKELFGQGFNNKKIWTEMYKWDKYNIISLLEGLITTDGCISKHNIMSLQMSNVNFMRDLYYLLRNNNIDTSYGKINKHKNSTKEHIQISIPVDVLDKSNINKCYTDDRMEFKQKYCKNQFSSKQLHGFKFLKFEDKMEITEALPQYVYTLGVEDDHSYNIEGIIAENCFLIGTDDSLDGIFKTITDCGKISKMAGGIGVHITNIRAKGSIIRGTNGPSDGVVPMIKVYNETAKYINQGSKRKGSFAIYIEPWHADIIEFLDLKKNQGHEDMRARDLFYALWVPDLFMKQVEADDDWYLMCPDECPGLTDLYGEDFEKLYWSYVEQKRYKHIVKAQEVWARILDSQMETGTPYIGYKDNVNKKCNQKNLGTIKSSNLCTEISLYSDDKEYAVCFTGDTEVLTDKGYLPIKECDGKRVLSYFDNDVNLKENQTWQTCKLIENGVKDVYEVDMYGNSPVKATSNHLFLTVSYKNKTKSITHEWKKLEELKNGDKICLPSHNPLPGYEKCDNIDTEYATIGWMLGDGWQSKGKNKTVYGVCFGPNDVYAKDIVVEQLCTWYNQSEKHKNDNSTGKTLNCYKDKNGVFNWSSSKQSFVSYIKQRFGLLEYKSCEKMISDQIKKNTSSAQISSFLSGLFSVDGSVYMSIVSNKFYVTLSSSSKNILQDVQRLLRRFGIKSNIMYYLEESKNRYQGKLTIENYSSILKYYDLIGFVLSKEKQEQLITGVKMFKKREKRRDYGVIKNISYVGKETVYDLNVPNTHNFIVEQLVVHNCNLASIALPKYVKYDSQNKPYFDFEHLRQISEYIVLPMNNVIDNNHYPVPETKLSNMKHRPIGIGIQGLVDVYVKMRFPFESEEAKQLNKEIFETIYYGTLQGSIALAKEEGSYSSFDGSPFSQGKLQFDLCAEYDGIDLKNYLSGRWDWDSLRSELVKYGTRNSMLMALMPTASTAQIMGNSEAFEPVDSCIFKRRVLSGEYIVVNKYLVEDLINLGLWSKELKDTIIANNGSIQDIDVIPDNLKTLYKTVWEISMKSVIEQCRDRGVFVDQMQSMNLFMANPNYKRLTSMHFYAWKNNLKTGMYYLRSKASASAGKFSIDPELEKRIKEKQERGEILKQEEEQAILACSRENPESCMLCSS